MRMIPGRTKVKIELFKGITLTDILIVVFAVVVLGFVWTSSIPGKFWIAIVCLLIFGVLLVRIDQEANYTLIINILRHYSYNLRYDNYMSEGSLKIENTDTVDALFEEDELSPKEMKRLLKEEEKKLKSKKVSDKEKADIKEAQRIRYERAAKVIAENQEAKGSYKPIGEIMGFTGISENLIDYDGQYYGAVLEIPPVEFRFFTAYRREASIEQGLGKILRSINPEYCVNIVKLERPVYYDDYLDNEYNKVDELKKAYEQGLITDDELKARVEICYDRIYEMRDYCFDKKIITPFYYLVLFESDKRQLEIQVRNAMSTLTAGEMTPKRLNDKELAVFLRYTNELDFDEREIDKIDPERYADWAMPRLVNIFPRSVRVNRIVTENFTVSGYPVVVGNAWLAGVFSLPSTKCVIKCKPMDNAKSIRTIDHSLTELRDRYRSTNVDSKRLELGSHIETLATLLAMLQGDNEYLMETSIYVTNYDIAATRANKRITQPAKSSHAVVSNMKKATRRAYQEAGMRLANNDFNQVKAFIGSQISGYDPLNREARGIPTNTIAGSYPWIYAGVKDKNGTHLGSSSGVPVFIDFFRRDNERVNSNMVIVGKSGSGKSYATKTLLSNLAADGAKIFILDPENEYTELADNLNGKFINVGNAQHGRLNPFQIITSLDDSDGDEGTISGSYATHLQFLEEFFTQILPDCEKEALEYLNSLIDRMYRDKGIDENTDLSKLKPGSYPIFDDLYDAVLIEFQQTTNEYIRSMLRILINYVAKFSTGGRNSNIWNGPSSISTDENFIVFNFQSLLANRNMTVANAQMLLVLKYVDNEIIKNRDYNRKFGLNRKIVVVIDEAHVFIDTKYPAALDFMFQMAKRIRKYNGMQIVITQNIKDFVGSEEIARKSTAIINACQYSLIFSLAPNDMHELCTLYEKAGGINEREQEQIISAPRGQAFTVLGPSSRTSFRVETSPGVEALFQDVGHKNKYFTDENGILAWEKFIEDSRARLQNNIISRLDEEEEFDEDIFEETVTVVDVDEISAAPQQETRKLDIPVDMPPVVTVNAIAAPEMPLPNMAVFSARADQMQTAGSQPPQAVAVQQIPAVVNVERDSKVEGMLAELMNKFSLEAIKSEVARAVETQVAAQFGTTEAAKAVAPIQPEVAALAEDATATEGMATAIGQIVPETMAVEVPAVEPAQEPEEEVLLESGMSLAQMLALQAKISENASPIDTMYERGISCLEVTLEDLVTYTSRNL